MRIAPRVILTSAEAQDAWDWVTQNISARPATPGTTCIYDRKSWQGKPLDQTDRPHVETAGHLYFISQLGNDQAIMRMVNGDGAQPVIVYTPSLDPDVAVVIKSKRRFRTALSEHLAFWVRLATASLTGVDFASTLPNFQPEDKGPDGLFVSTGSSTDVEIQSVKNSINDPRTLIATRELRTRGTGLEKKGKLLDDFWLLANKGFGIKRLDRMLSKVYMYLGVSPAQQVQMGLQLGICRYNGVVFADEVHQCSDLFEGFEHVCRDPFRCIATYIGSDSWVAFAESTRQYVLAYLVGKGII